MRLFLQFTLGLFLVVAVSSSVTAQQMSCDSLMHFGIYDQYDTLSESSQFRLFKTWMCESKFSSYQEASSAATQMGFGVDIFSINFGGTSAQSQWAIWKSNLCKASYEEVRNNQSYKNSIRVISPALMAVVGKCIESQANGVFYSWIETTKDRKIFTFNARYIPRGEEAAKVKSFSMTPPSIKKNCQDTSLLDPGKTFVGATKIVTCSVNPATTLVVTLNTTQGSGSPKLDGYVSPKPSITDSLATLLDHGRVGIVVFDKLTSNLGSIRSAISTYQVTYSSSDGVWTSTGTNAYGEYKKDVKYGPNGDNVTVGRLNQAYPPKDHYFVIFGAEFIFDDEGKVYLSNPNRAEVGHLFVVH